MVDPYVCPSKSTLRGKVDLILGKVDFQLKDDFAPRTKDKDASLVFRPKTKSRLWSWGKVRSSSDNFPSSHRSNSDGLDLPTRLNIYSTDCGGRVPMVEKF